MQVHRGFNLQDDQEFDQPGEQTQLRPFFQRSSAFREDWLLPKVEIPFTEPDMYENVLNSSWNSVIFKIATPDSLTAVKDVNSDDFLRTISMSDILPEIRLCEPIITEDEPVTPDFGDVLSSISCSHCGTDKTSLWRRREGRLVCNACALYEKLHGIPRPAHLLHQSLRRRNRSDSARRRKRS